MPIESHAISSLPATLLSLLFSTVAVRAADPPPPACATPAHGEFDFWIGDWDVTLADGKPAGTSHIEKILAGCVIFENWQSARSPYAGRSFNTWDPLTATWNQVWVDSDGATIQFSGRRNGNVMDMTGRQNTAAGTLHFQMSYTLNDDDTVRQLWQQSKDRQQWEVIFDGRYRRK
jgi:hypothetical protein